MATDPERLLLESFQRSKFWSWTRDYLLARREQLFAATPTTTPELWMQRGAIQEVMRLLSGPQIVLKYYQEQQKNQDKQDNNHNSYNGDNDPSESPSSATEGIGLFMRTTDEW